MSRLSVVHMILVNSVVIGMLATASKESNNMSDDRSEASEDRPEIAGSSSAVDSSESSSWIVLRDFAPFGAREYVLESE